MEEVRQDEAQTRLMMWMVERITTLQNENEEMKNTVHEMTLSVELRGDAIVSLVERFREWNAITLIDGHVKQQADFNQRVKTSVASLVEK